jgi:adenylate kinase family enzyme
VPERFVIQGISGSGKTTLARELGRLLGIPHLETDSLVHGHGWAEVSDAGLFEHLVEFTAQEHWVVDADYHRKVGTLVFERADTVVWLDLPLHVTLRRLWQRTAARIEGSETIWNGNRESWQTALWGWDSLFVYALRRRRRLERELPRILSRPRCRHVELVRLRSEDEVRAWLSRTCADPAKPPAEKA